MVNSTGGFQVSPDALSQHARDVGDIMKQITDAANQAGNVVDFAAFGLIGEPWAQILRVWMNSAKDYIGAAAKAGNSVAAGVQQASESYRNNEQSVARYLQAIGGTD
ncbi:MAG TPA: type VII secretion target [Amycolatopsis sp.]|jgi:hypothetical protein|nr:type VII secretion target [Amycolatopsis sp.]